MHACHCLPVLRDPNISCLARCSISAQKKHFTGWESGTKVEPVGMDLQLQYQHTFITVEEPKEVLLSRSKSLPPMKFRGSSDEATEAQVMELEMADYVTRLAGNAALNFGQKNSMQQDAEVLEVPETLTKENLLDSIDSDSNESTVVPYEELASKGSLGHPDVCRRPCVYFKSGNCEHGSSCGFCHMEHSDRLPKLDKKQRELIRSFTKSEVLSIMLRYLRLAAAKQGFELQATEILELVEHEVLAEGQDPNVALERVPEKMFKRLHKTLIRMHFAGIVGLASKEQIGELRQNLADALERLREVAPQSRVQPQE